MCSSSLQLPSTGCISVSIQAPSGEGQGCCQEPELWGEIGSFCVNPGILSLNLSPLFQHSRPPPKCGLVTGWEGFSTQCCINPNVEWTFFNIVGLLIVKFHKPKFEGNFILSLNATVYKSPLYPMPFCNLLPAIRHTW